MSRCQGTTKAGQPCRASALTNRDYCIRHKDQEPTRQVEHGFYGRTYTGKELADLVALAGEHSLDDEIGASRVAIRRLIEYINEHGADINSDEYGRLATLIFTGSNTVARLLRTRHILEGGNIDDLTGALAGALNALNAEWDLDL